MWAVWEIIYSVSTLDSHTCTFIQERNHIHVTIVGNHSLSLETWLATCAFIQERNPIHVSSVGNYLLSLQTWLHTCTFIQERNLIHVSIVGNHSLSLQTWLYTCLHSYRRETYSCDHVKLLWEIIHTGEKQYSAILWKIIRQSRNLIPQAHSHRREAIFMWALWEIIQFIFKLD